MNFCEFYAPVFFVYISTGLRYLFHTSYVMDTGGFMSGVGMIFLFFTIYISIFLPFYLLYIFILYPLNLVPFLQKSQCICQYIYFNFLLYKVNTTMKYINRSMLTFML